MAVLISLTETTPLWYRASFPFERRTIEALKAIPGSAYTPETKTWKVPRHALPAMDACGLKYAILSHSMRPTARPLDPLMSKLRPYQQDGVMQMLANPAFVLAFHPRVGKTPTGSVAIASMLASGLVQTAVVMYPNQVRDEWTRQMPAFTMGLQMVPVNGVGDFDPTPLYQRPFLVIGVHYELLRAEGKRDDGGFDATPTVQKLLHLIKSRGRYIVAADEPQLIRNRKSPRAQLFMQLGRNADYRWALTGTPMRSRPRDMFPLWEFLQAGSMGSYSKFTERYAGGHLGDHGWVDKGTGNEDELRVRLQSVWLEKTRRDAAPWLPKADRRIFLCDLNAAQAKAYRQAELAIGQQAMQVTEGSEAGSVLAAMRKLADMVSQAKMGTMLERVRYHVGERRVKALIFALHHETLQKAWATLQTAKEKKTDKLEQPVYVAGGWLLPAKRKEAIAAWKACPGPAVLMINTLSSGIGIDLADAEVAIGLEAAWVPSDFIQMEARIEDVHQGKRKTSAIYEYLLAKNTVDEDMVSKLIEKLAAAEAVTGMDSQRDEMATALREAGVVDRNILSLAREDDATVMSALDALRARLTSENPELYDSGDNAEPDFDPDDEDTKDDEEDFYDA